jgi:hypothetical protein
VRAAHAPLDEATLRDALDLAIGQRLEVSEADKLQAYPLDEGDLDAALAAFQAKFSSPAEFTQFLARYEAEPSQLAAVLGRSLRTAKILDGKLRLRAQVSEAEVRRAYDEQVNLLGAGRFEEFRSSLRQKLSADKLKKLAAAELIQARKGADVRLIAPFARERKPAGP